MKWILIEGYQHIGTNEKVCSGEPVVIGTRIEPRFIASYGSIEDTMEDFNLTKEQVKEAIKFTRFQLKKDNKEND